jgi:hypothetical protein
MIEIRLNGAEIVGKIKGDIEKEIQTQIAKILKKKLKEINFDYEIKVGEDLVSDTDHLLKGLRGIIKEEMESYVESYVSDLIDSKIYEFKENVKNAFRCCRRDEGYADPESYL